MSVSIGYLPCGREIVLAFVDDFFLKDVTGLLSDTLSKIVVVDLDHWHIAFVSWNDCGLLLDWGLLKEIEIYLFMY